MGIRDLASVVPVGSSPPQSAVESVGRPHQSLARMQAPDAANDLGAMTLTHREARSGHVSIAALLVAG